MNSIFSLLNPALDRKMYICKVNVFIQQAKYE